MLSPGSFADQQTPSGTALHAKPKRAALGNSGIAESYRSALRRTAVHHHAGAQGSGADVYAPLLAAAVTSHVIPLLRSVGRLPE
jgi:hypothetical protein